MASGLLEMLNSPAGIGLLSAIAGGAAGARRGTPWNNVGRGMVTGLTGYQTATDAQKLEQEKQRKKLAMADVFNSAMTPGRAAMPAMYGVGDTQGNEAYARMAMGMNRDINEMSQMPASNKPGVEVIGLPRQSRPQGVPLIGDSPPPGQYAATPDNEQEYSDTLQARDAGLPVKLLPQMSTPQAEEQMPRPQMLPQMQPTEWLPEQAIQTRAAQEAQAGGFDRDKLLMNMMQNPDAGFQDVALKSYLDQKAAKQPEAYSLSPGQVRYGADNQQIAAVPATPKEGSDPLGQDMLEILAIKGIDPRTATPQQLQAAYDEVNRLKERRVPKTTVSVGGARVFNEAEKKMGAGMGDYAIELRKNADSAYRAADEVNYVVDALRGYGGGPLTTAKAFVGKFSPDSDWGKLSSVGELASTVQAKLAPSMRAAGSGATSDFEMKMWMKAIPTLATTEVGRELMRKYTNRVAERAAARADIEAQLIDERGRVEYSEVYRRMKAKFGDTFLDPSDKNSLSGRPSIPVKNDARSRADAILRGN